MKHRLLNHADRSHSYTYALAIDVAREAGQAQRATEATLSAVPNGPMASTVT